MRARRDIHARRPLFDVRPFGALVGVWLDSAPRQRSPHSRADMEHRAKERSDEGVRASPGTFNVTNNVVLSPYFSALIKRFETSAIWPSSSSYGIKNAFHNTDTKTENSHKRSLVLQSAHQDRRVHRKVRGYQFREPDHTITHRLSSSSHTLGASQTKATRDLGRLTTRLSTVLMRSHRGTMTQERSRSNRVVFHQLERHFFGLFRAAPSLSITERARLVRTQLVERALAARPGAQVTSPQSHKSDLMTPNTQLLRVYREADATLPTKAAAVSKEPVQRSMASVERAFRAPDAPDAAQHPPVPEQVIQQAPPEPKFDLNQLETDLWQRFERRIRIEHERRGRH